MIFEQARMTKVQYIEGNRRTPDLAPLSVSMNYTLFLADFGLILADFGLILVLCFSRRRPL